MSFVQGTSGNTVAVFPVREFRLVFDPTCLTSVIQWPGYRQATDLIANLEQLGPTGVRIELLLPTYLSTQVRGARDLPDFLAPAVRLHTNTDEVPAFVPSDRMKAAPRAALTADTDDAGRARQLAALALHAQADGVIVPLNSLLAEHRWEVYQRHRLRVIPLDELGAFVEWCAHGHGIFWSANHAMRTLAQDLYYHVAHPKCARLVTWFHRIQHTLTDPELHETVRSALLNRYPFILYSRDMVRFYEIQVDHFARRGLYRRFGWALGYYITAFYLHVWGMLEQLTLIANGRLELGLSDEQCGIHKDRTLWKALGAREPGLRNFVKTDPIAAWTAAMSDVRHAAAHRAMLLPAPLVSHTAESQLSDDEVRERLRAEEPGYYAHMPEEVIAAIEPMRIWHWRVRHVETIGDNVVMVKGKSGTYVRGAVVSIDYDLTMLEAVMDAFLVALFRQRPAP